MNYETWPRLVVVDVEGNGANPPDLVEVAVLPLLGGYLDHKAAGAWLIRPPVPVTPFATRVHKLTNNDLADCPTWAEVAGEVGAALGDAWICAHNASVEYRVLRRHLPTWAPAGVIDTLRLARAAYPEAPRHTLDSLIEHLDLDLTDAPGQRHRAAFDAYAAAQLLLAAADRHSTWGDVAAHAALPGVGSAQQTSTVADTLF